MKRFKFFHNIPPSFQKEKGKTYIAIVGGRNVDSFGFVEKKFLETIKEMEIEKEDVVIVSGGAKGVDSFAKKIALKHNIDIIEIIPLWSKYGKKAGLLRNHAIISLSDIVIAIPDKKSKGTWHSVKLARKQGKKLVVELYKK